MAAVLWTARAEQDLEEILAFYIGTAGLPVARSIFRRIRAHVENLRQFPQRTRFGRVYGTRELVIQRLPYLVVIQVEGERVLVLNVIHTARKYPA